jgi:Spy/CpxP family protein refolding chaperone
MNLFRRSLSISLLSTGLTLVVGTAAIAENHGSTTSEQMAAPQEPMPIAQTSAGSSNLTEDFEEQPRTAEDIFAETLNLSEDQRNEIQEIFTEYQPSIQQKFQDYLAAVEVLNSALTPATDTRMLVRARDEAVSLERETYDVLFERKSRFVKY